MGFVKQWVLVIGAYNYSMALMGKSDAGRCIFPLTGLQIG